MKPTHTFLTYGSVLIFYLALPKTYAQAPIPPGTSTYESSQVDRQPEPRREVHVRYSSALRREHAEITLRFLVTTEGKVSQLTVVKFTDDDMVEPTYRAYENASFTPGVKNGKAVDTWMEVTETAK